MALPGGHPETHSTARSCHHAHWLIASLWPREAHVLVLTHQFVDLMLVVLHLQMSTVMYLVRAAVALVAHFLAVERVAGLEREEKEAKDWGVVEAGRELVRTADQRRHKKTLMLKWRTIGEAEPKMTVLPNLVWEQKVTLRWLSKRTVSKRKQFMGCSFCLLGGFV